MAHYAQIENDVVTNVIVAEQDFIDYLKSQNSAAQWIQTSYNTRGGVHYDPVTGEPSADQTKALRKNYASIGYTYNQELDAFIAPKPYPSWTLNQETCLWVPPVPYPADGSQLYTWDEPTQNWVTVNPPV
ncbi:MAG: hypothetical protein EBU08_18625 [Micrococcales bacterium]|nr:hypothetical protein [Micrococcales bacterium]